MAAQEVIERGSSTFNQPYRKREILWPERQLSLSPTHLIAPINQSCVPGPLEQNYHRDYWFSRSPSLVHLTTCLQHVYKLLLLLVGWRPSLLLLLLLPTFWLEVLNGASTERLEVLHWSISRGGSSGALIDTFKIFFRRIW